MKTTDTITTAENIINKTDHLSSGAEEFDCVIEAGKILMESGAEIYRIEETMRHMASSLKIDRFEAFVVNGGIIASGTARDGIRESRVTSAAKPTSHLGKIEAVNALSREMEQKGTFTADEISKKLRDIVNMPDPLLRKILMAYFIGAGCFSYAIGSSVLDSLSSAIVGLVMGLALQVAGKWIRSEVLLTIIGSAVVTFTASLLYVSGFGEHRGLIILGTLMLIVPGAAFTNSVREFSQNNHVTGLMLLMSSLLVCLSISCGVALTIELLPFVDHMTSVFSGSVDGVWDVIIRTVMAGVGTVAFSFLFHTPKKYYFDVGMLGAVSWMLYLLLSMVTSLEALIIFVPALFVAVFSRWLSVKRKCPATVFLFTSIFPLIPGLSFYRAVYFLLTGMPELAGSYMRSCFHSALAIALAIIIVQEIRRKTDRERA